MNGNLTEAVILADSVGETNKNHRLITLKLYYPRFIHPEFLTHRSLSRNSESSRAVPSFKRLKTKKYVPTQFGRKVKGMGCGEPLHFVTNCLAVFIWKVMIWVNQLGCYLLSKCGVAKQWSNRSLDWCSYIEVIATGDYDSWQHFLSLRDHPDAQPEMQELAKCIRKAIDESIPKILKIGEIHLPYDKGENSGYSLEERNCISVGLCAGVSYLNKIEDNRALDLGKKMKNLRHYSPYEHQAQCMPYGQKYANLNGWMSYRYVIEEQEKEKKENVIDS